MRFFRLILLVTLASLLSGCTFFAKPQYAGIQVVTTENTSSAVFLDDQHINNTPLTEKTIKPGRYSLKIVPENPQLVPYETTVTLRAGLLTVVTWKPAERPELSGGVIYEMEPLSDRTKNEISFITIPDGAIISFEGEDQLFSPTSITDVTPGQHEYEITLPSYEIQKHTINVVAGYRMIVRSKLAKTSASTTVPTEVSTESDTATTNANASSSATINATSQAKTATSSATATGVKILSTGYFSNSQEVLRVRDKAGAVGTEIGFLAVGEVVPYLGETQGGWHKITFKQATGWVSADFSQLVE